MTATSAVSSTNATPPVASGKTGSAIDQLSGSFNTFLKLLTTQLQNQDPTKPMDTNEFTQQLVQYSQVEQQIKTNDHLATVVANSNKQASAAAVGFLGQTVSVDGANATLSNGSAQWNYTLPQDADAVNLSVLDSNGKTIQFLKGDPTKGTHAVEWNGMDYNNNKVADGIYTLSISAKDAAGLPMKSSTTSNGTVSSISYDSKGNAQLIIGGKAYQTSAILAVQAQTAAGSNNNTIAPAASRVGVN